MRCVRAALTSGTGSSTPTTGGRGARSIRGRETSGCRRTWCSTTSPVPPRSRRHARTVGNAPNEPNALHHPNTIALNEGLTERRSANDFRAFTARAGYEDLVLENHQYEGAVEAVDQLISYAADSEREDQLVTEALQQPVAMQWDPIANEIVRNQLGDVVPQDPRHQAAARAELVNAMSSPPWHGIQHRPREGLGGNQGSILPHRGVSRSSPASCGNRADDSRG